MTITPTELRRMCDIEDLAKLAGLDPNKTPRQYHDFCAAAEAVIVEAEKRGAHEAQGKES